MNAFRTFTAVAAMAGTIVATGFAQRMMGAGPRDFGSGDLAKIFGNNQAFTATANISVADAQHSSPIEMEAAYAFLKGNLRTDLDMTSMKGSQMPPQAMAQMKQMGMDRAVNIYRTDKKVMYLIYPGMKSYTEIIPPQASPTDKTEAKEPKVDITTIGKDTVDGHPCVKCKLTFAADDGSTHEVLAWQATDLNNFPIKTEMQAAGSTITTHFTNIKLSAPDASLFDPPSGYTRYGSIQEMMMGSLQHMMPPGAGPRGGGNY